MEHTLILFGCLVFMAWVGYIVGVLHASNQDEKEHHLNQDFDE